MVRFPVPRWTVYPLYFWDKTGYTKGMKVDERAMTASPLALVNNENVWNACDDAIANFLGSDDYDRAMVDVVAGRVTEGLEKLLDVDNYFTEIDFETLIESASTYVQTDLEPVELACWCSFVEDSLEIWGCY